MYLPSFGNFKFLEEKFKTPSSIIFRIFSTWVWFDGRMKPVSNMNQSELDTYFYLILMFMILSDTTLSICFTLAGWDSTSLRGKRISRLASCNKSWLLREDSRIFSSSFSRSAGCMLSNGNVLTMKLDSLELAYICAPMFTSIDLPTPALPDIIILLF